MNKFSAVQEKLISGVSIILDKKFIERHPKEKAKETP